MNRQELEEKIIKKAWEDSEYKKRLLADPKAVIHEELGEEAIPDFFEVKVLEETDDTGYIRIPRNPEEKNSQELSDDDLENVAGGFLPCVKNCSRFSLF